ncbi:Exocyst complex component EXO70A1 [Carex littledalei]|uniref:Exocyst subunit Exo70 family protein n=1 Tax=Carex littledalei TaxID=544730 RepID=A0A833R6M4_9POAL|nr:Exocyst complex component EXO70A1 [Carex littledalei]
MDSLEELKEKIQIATEKANRLKNSQEKIQIATEKLNTVVTSFEEQCSTVADVIRPIQEEGFYLGPSILRILQSLQINMENKSGEYTYRGQSHFFMMNNIYYMVTSVCKNDAAKQLLGDSWIEEQRQLAALNARQYESVAWAKVLESLQKPNAPPWCTSVNSTPTSFAPASPEISWPPAASSPLPLPPPPATSPFPNPNTFMYNILIRAFSKSSTPDLALELFVEMLYGGTMPDRLTFPSVFLGYSRLGWVRSARELHGMVVKLGLAGDISTCVMP